MVEDLGIRHQALAKALLDERGAVYEFLETRHQEMLKDFIIKRASQAEYSHSDSPSVGYRNSPCSSGGSLDEAAVYEGDHLAEKKATNVSWQEMDRKFISCSGKDWHEMDRKFQSGNFKSTDKADNVESHSNMYELDGNNTLFSSMEPMAFGEPQMAKKRVVRRSVSTDTGMESQSSLNKKLFSKAEEIDLLPAVKRKRSDQKTIRTNQVMYPNRKKNWVSVLATSTWFEGFFAILIIANALTLCGEAQYHGFDTGFDLGLPGSKPASETWPHADVVFKVLDIFFGLAFVLEVAIKLTGLQADFFWSAWNWLDTVIIAAWIMGIVFSDILPVDPLLLRLARLTRLIRIMRLVRTIQIFDILHLMVASLRASMSALFWSVVLLFGIMMSASLVLISTIEFYIVDESKPYDQREEAYRYFGNFSRAFLSVFELTLGNWVPIVRFMHGTISEVYATLFMVYYCLVSFAILMVIRGIFLHETFQAADSNDNLMILKQLRSKTSILEKLRGLFWEADVAPDGLLSHEDFTLFLRETRVQTWLAAFGLEVRDADIIFQMVEADGDNRINVQEFVSGFARLKGNARAVDMVQVLRYSRTIMETLAEVNDSLRRFTKLSNSPGQPHTRTHRSDISTSFVDDMCGEVADYEGNAEETPSEEAYHPTLLVI